MKKPMSKQEKIMIAFGLALGLVCASLLGWSIYDQVSHGKKIGFHINDAPVDPDMESKEQQ